MNNYLNKEGYTAEECNRIVSCYALRNYSKETLIKKLKGIMNFFYFWIFQKKKLLKLFLQNRKLLAMK